MYDWGEEKKRLRGEKNNMTSSVVVEPANVDTISWLECIQLLAELAAPATISQFLTISAQSLSTMFVGRFLGPDALAAVSLGTRFISNLGVKFGVGVGTAVDTLCSQEHGRDTNSTAHGEIVQRAFAIQLIVASLSSIVFLTSPLYFTTLFGTPIGSLAAMYIVAAGTLYVIPIFGTTTLTKCLQSIGFATLPTIATAIATCSCVIWNVALIPMLGMYGAALALALTAWVQFIALCVLSLRQETVRRALGVTLYPLRRILDPTGIHVFLKLGVPSAGMVVSESTPFSLMIVFASVLGGLDASSYSASYAVANLMFTTAYGMSGASAARVGNALGSNRPHRARRLCVAAVALTLVISLCNVLLLLVTQNWMFSLFTSDEVLIQRCIALIPYMCAVHIVDCVQFAFQGIFAACGKTHLGFLVIMLTLVCTSIPTAAVLAFRFRLGAAGLYTGLGIGLLLAIPLFAVTVFFYFDFEKLAQIASQKKVAKYIGEDFRHTNVDEMLP